MAVLMLRFRFGCGLGGGPRRPPWLPDEEDDVDPFYARGGVGLHP